MWRCHQKKKKKKKDPSNDLRRHAAAADGRLPHNIGDKLPRTVVTLGHKNTRQEFVFKNYEKKNIVRYTRIKKKLIAPRNSGFLLTKKKNLQGLSETPQSPTRYPKSSADAEA